MAGNACGEHSSARRVPGVPGEEEPPSYEVLAALVASLRRELAGAVTALEQGPDGAGRCPRADR
jgi:hypothetical protein